MAFPNTPVLDALTSSGGLSANWTTPGRNGASNFVMTESAAGATTGTDNGSTYGNATWNQTSFSANQEIYATVSNAGSAGYHVRLYGRMSTPTANDGYLLDVTGSTWTLFGATGNPTRTQAISAGDSIGLSLNGSTLTLYYKAAAGSWGAVGAAITDSSITQAGYMGMELQRIATPAIYQNFGGGSIGASVIPPDNSNPNLLFFFNH